jgi:pantothenate kinase-related protein Tda10
LSASLAEWRAYARAAAPLSKHRHVDAARPADITYDEWSTYLESIARPIAALVRALSVRFLGISGPPGSGKSTLADVLSAALRSETSEPLTLSLDDFYLTREERAALGVRWRGGPGSHDLTLLVDTLERLHSKSKPITVPRFSALADDRTQPDTLTSVPSHVLLEGWFLGYTGDGYGRILDYLDLLVFLDLDVRTSKQRRFAREDALRASGGGFSAEEMQGFWNEVLQPGIEALVPVAKRSAGLILEVGGDQGMRAVEVRDERVFRALGSR